MKKFLSGSVTHFSGTRCTHNLLCSRFALALGSILFIGAAFDKNQEKKENTKIEKGGVAEWFKAAVLFPICIKFVKILSTNRNPA